MILLFSNALNITLHTITDSRFEVLTGVVLLGPNPDLLNHAAQPGEQVTVVATDGNQTALVEPGAQVTLSFDSFVRNGSDILEPETATVTLLFQRFGTTARTILEPTAPGSRVSVSNDDDSMQFFVVIANATGDDSGIYTVEVCPPGASGGDGCMNASITLFVLTRKSFQA